MGIDKLSHDARVARANALLDLRQVRAPLCKSFLSLDQLHREEILGLIQLGIRLKSDEKLASGVLSGQSVALLFQKTSTRTRCSFEIACGELGAQPMYVDWQSSNFTRGDLGDEIRVLSRYVSAVVARVYKHQDLIDMARTSEAPIINGLSDFNHPCQGLADLMTIYEYFGSLDEITVAYIGDGNNICNTLLECAHVTNVNLRLSFPQGYSPDENLLQRGRTNGNVVTFSTPAEALAVADVIYTDTWISMGDEEQEAERLKVFPAFSLTADLVSKAPRHALIMHCLPAHRGQEITSEVLDGRNSVVFDQAENRKHAQKALMLWLFDVSNQF